MRRKVALILLMSLSLCGCSKEDKKKGTKLGAPPIEPPVSRNVPSAMAALQLIESNNALGKIKDKMFSGGPTDIRQTLEIVDGFVSNLESTLEDEQRACVATDPLLVELAGTLPGEVTFPLYLQCKAINGNAETAIGVKDDFVYMYSKFIPQGATEPFIIAAKSSTAGDFVEFWTIVAEPNKQSVPYITLDSYNFVHGAAKDSTSEFELTTGGKFPGLGINCGTHMRSIADRVFATGTFAAFEYPQGEDCSNSSDKTQLESVCASSTDFSILPSSECSAISETTLLSLSYADSEAVGGYENAFAFRNTDLSAVPSAD